MTIQGASLQIVNLQKKWEKTDVLKGLNFSVEAGTFLTLLGPSGCGKSTALRLIAGLEVASGGEILINAQEVSHLPPSKRQVGMVFQNYALFPHLSVEKNLLFGLEVRGESKQIQYERLQRIVPILGLSKLLGRKPAQLSGGQQQRVALGRALIAEQPLCLLDEPLSNLDAKLRTEMRAEIRELQQRLGITMVFVTHDQTEAMSMSDKIALMQDGKIEQFGTPEELYYQPVSEFVAKFIGTPPANILEADELNKFGFNVSENYRVGIRPEEIKISDSGIPAIVLSVEYFGADSIIKVQLSRSCLNVRVEGKTSLKKNHMIHVIWPESAMFFFNIETGLRM